MVVVAWNRAFARTARAWVAPAAYEADRMAQVMPSSETETSHPSRTERRDDRTVTRPEVGQPSVSRTAR